MISAGSPLAADVHIQDVEVLVSNLDIVGRQALVLLGLTFILSPVEVGVAEILVVIEVPTFVGTLAPVERSARVGNNLVALLPVRDESVGGNKPGASPRKTMSVEHHGCSPSAVVKRCRLRRV